MSEKRPAAQRLPLLLIASGHEWVERALEGIVAPTGMTVVKADSAKHALECARAVPPDAIILDSSLPDADSLDLCRTLRQDQMFPAQMPIILVASAAPPRRSDRMAALRAGAWDYYNLPLDSEELLLRLETYLRAKLATDQIRAAGLEDQLTGLYNLQGLLRRLREMCSDAFRKHRALSCLLIAPDLSGSAADPERDALTPVVAEQLVWIVGQACRASDTIARLPTNEFVVLAPETGPEGAHRLADRLTTTAGSSTPAGQGIAGVGLQLRIGLYSVSDFTAAAIDPNEVLVRAKAALERSKAPNNTRIYAYSPEMGPTH